MDLDQLLRDTAPDGAEMHRNAERMRPAVVARFDTTHVRRRHSSRRWAAGLTVAAAAATAFVIASPGGPATTPAYAIDRDADGDVMVRIHRLEDSDGLEKALAGHGIDADVSFEPGAVEIGDQVTFTVLDGAPGDAPPSDHAREGDTGEVEPDAGGQDLLVSGGTMHQQARPADPDDVSMACGKLTGEAPTLRHEDDDWVLRIPAGSPLQDRPVTITTGSGGELGVYYEGTIPDSFCGVLSVGG